MLSHRWARFINYAPPPDCAAKATTVIATTTLGCQGAADADAARAANPLHIPITAVVV